MDAKAIQNLVVQLAIAFIVLGIVYAQVALPQLNTGIQTAIASANAQNYTATASTLNKFTDWIKVGITLLVLGTALIPLADIFRKGTRNVAGNNLVAKVVGYSTAVLMLGVLFFGIGLPYIIDAQAISDSMLSGIVALLGVGVLSMGIAAVTTVAGRVAKARRRKTASAIAVYR